MASSKIAEEKHLEMTHRQRHHSFLQFPSLEHVIWQQKNKTVIQIILISDLLPTDILYVRNITDISVMCQCSTTLLYCEEQHLKEQTTYFL